MKAALAVVGGLAFFFFGLSVGVVLLAVKPPPPPPPPSAAELECAHLKGRLEELEHRTGYHQHRIEDLRRVLEVANDVAQANKGKGKEKGKQWSVGGP